MISQGRYSHASDVWSFGVLAWELFAAFYDSNIMPRQTIPYYNHTNDEVTPCKILKFKISIPQGICMLKNQRNIKIKRNQRDGWLLQSNIEDEIEFFFTLTPDCMVEGKIIS